MSDHIRVLQCWDCRSMEELADFQGLPEHDHVLQHIDERHGGQSAQPHNRALHRVGKEHWDDRAVRKQIVKQMWASTTGFVPEYYHTRDTMHEDAAKCFAKHHRQVPCLDYQDSSKRLGNPAWRDRLRLTKELRRDVGDLGPGPKVYLCNFCPIQTYVDRAKHDHSKGQHQY